MSRVFDPIDPLCRFSAQQTLFISGAGISMDAPSNGPSGPTLTARALEHAYMPGTSDAIAAAYARLGQQRVAGRPRLEAILDVVLETHGEELLRDLLSDLRHARHNELHRFFARHLELGGRHITANFDNLIEQALASESQSPIHFHGAFGVGPAAESLGATLREIQYGFATAMRRRLTNALASPEIEHIVIVGYSGSDYFDMDPYLEQLAQGGTLADKAITLFWHGPNTTLELSPTPEEFAPLRPFVGQVPHLAVVIGQTAVALGRISEGWGVAAPTSSSGQTLHFTPTSGITESALEQATAMLFSHMGLFSDLGFAARDKRFAPSIRAEIAWAEGRYRRCKQLRLEGVDSSTFTGQAQVAVAKVEYLWIRGAYLRAYFTGRRALANERLIRGAEPDSIVKLYEMLGRVLVHMGRCPDIRWFASDKRKADVEARLLLFAREHERFASGVHWRNRISSVLSDLRRDNAPTVDDLRESKVRARSFDELESLNSALNYEHGELTKRINGGERASNDEHRRLARRYQAIGQLQSAARVRFMPGAGYAFALHTTLLSLVRLEATPWHKVRLAGGLLVERLRSRSRHAMRTGAVS